MTSYRQAAQAFKRGRRGSDDGNPGGGSGTPDAGQSTCTATTPVTVGDLVTVTITAKGPSGSPIANVSCTIAVSGTGNTLNQPSSITDASGVTTATFSSTVAETKTVTATAGGVTITQQPSVVVNASAGLSAGDIVSEHFATYSSTANMLADPRGIYIPSDDVNPAQIVLDTSVGYTAGGLTQSCRFDYPARPGNCGDYTITRSLAFPADQTDVYVRIIAKWSPTWTNDAGAGCASNMDFKFIFLGVRTAGRYNVMVGTYNAEYTVGYPSGEDNFEGGSIADWDGLWHTYWFHGKDGTSGACAFARDTTIVKDYGVVNTSPGGQIYKLTMARNINQGPPAAQSLWYGAMDVFSTKPAGCPLP